MVAPACHCAGAAAARPPRRSRPPAARQPFIYPPLLLIHEYVDAPVIQELAEHVDVAGQLKPVPSVVPGKGEGTHADARSPEHAARGGPAMAHEQVSRGAIGTALEA